MYRMGLAIGGMLAALPAMACVSRVEHQSVVVELHCSPFQVEKRRTLLPAGKPVMVDGRVAYGPDGILPRTSVDILKVMTEGRTFSMPREMLQDLYDPRIAPQHPNSLTVQRSAADMLLFRFSGGENARAYDAMWVLNTGNGEVTRFIYTPPGSTRGVSMKGIASDMTVQGPAAKVKLPQASGVTGKVIERLEDPPK